MELRRGQREIQRYLSRQRESGLGESKATPVSTRGHTPRPADPPGRPPPTGVSGHAISPLSTFEYPAPRGHPRVTHLHGNSSTARPRTTPRPRVTCWRVVSCRAAAVACHGSALIRLRTYGHSARLDGWRRTGANSTFYWRAACFLAVWPGLDPVACCDLLVVTQFRLISICPAPRRAVWCVFFAPWASLFIYMHWATPPSPGDL